MNICVYAAASEDIDKKYLIAAGEFGRALTARSHSLIFGGGATGLMGAVARAAEEAGGVITGIAPYFFDTDGVLFNKCNELIFTETMRERKQVMEDMADAFVTLPGGIGTYEEFFEILTLRQLGLHMKPIAVLNINGYYDDLNRLIKKAADEGFLKRENLSLYRSFTDPEELLNWLENIK